jgi:hypothetical protein
VQRNSRHEPARESQGALRYRADSAHPGQGFGGRGHLDEAELRLQEALTFFRDDVVSQKRPELAAQAENWLGFIQLRRKAYAKAETNLLSGWEQFSPPK